VYGVARDVTERRMANAELGALRRVATFAAEGVAPSELFAIVAEAVARVVNVPLVVVARYELDGTVTQCASFPTDHSFPTGQSLFPVGKRWSLAGRNVVELVRTSSEAARIDDYAKLDGELAEAARRIGLHSTVGIPIVVAGHLWGAIVVSTTEPNPLPEDTAARLASFTELLATAIANAESRETLGRLADEQTALRRVATLVARGTPPSEVFAAVANEMARCLDAANVTVSKFADDTVTIVAVAALTPGIKHAPLVGIRRTLAAGDNIATRVFQTGRPARLEGLEFQNAPGSVAAWLRKTGLRCSVAVPVIVDGGVWGMAALGSLQPEPMPPDTEARMSDFADLVGTAITNAATRAELIASRARIVAAADEGRRRLERDLHDGAQQRLVALGLQTRLAEATVPPKMQALKQQLCDIVSALTSVSADLQEISRGIHPAILSKGGLGPALKTLARRSSIPVTLDLTIDQPLPDSVEVGAYYVVSEALTNAAKHSRATEVAISGQTNDDMLSLSIRDDGIGGADTGNGSGLVGLADRVEALGGRMHITSPVGSGTSLEATIPLDGT
jgi:signal transduction histidine kinase